MKDKNIASVLKQSMKKTGITEKNTMKFQCMLCNDDTPHMIVIMNKDGDIHVHAPFDNKYAISQLIDAVVEEQKKYNSK